MIIFHTDLDNTLIYSYKHDIGADKRCVEVYNGREISFITQNTYQLLQKIHSQENDKNQLIMVPTTTRTIEQYQRINLGVGDFQYALVCNGGVLLVDGKEDEGWYRESLKLVQNSREQLEKALELLDKEKRRTFELRFIKDLFVFTKCEEPEAVAEALRKVLKADVVDVFNNGVKVYVVPKTLNKGKAVERFKSYVGAGYVIAAGDSEFDISMLEAADLGIAAPCLAQNYSFSDKVYSLQMKSAVSIAPAACCKAANFHMRPCASLYTGRSVLSTASIQCPSVKKLYSETVLDTVLQISADRHYIKDF
ncbi:MAG: HAD hydrolase family protein [Lachnospiraceae bacterium]|nr:HAD hydrolase family protein [Lachnospiraceae bacterium]